MKVRPTPTFWGATALVSVLLLLIVIGALYVSPLNERSVVFYTTDSNAIRPGDSVRIAGIVVGRVQSVSLEDNRVRVETKVERDAFVGDQSQVEVRMLTLVGGYYVNLISLGDTDLHEAIPIERARMPYSLTEAIADVGTVTDRVDSQPLNTVVDQLQTALTGDRVDTLSALVEAGNGLVSTIDHQRGQVSAILNMTGEYMQAINGFRGQFAELIRKAAIFEQTLVLYGKGWGGALYALGDIGQRLKPIGVFYERHRSEVMSVVEQVHSMSDAFQQQVGPVIDNLTSAREQLQLLLDSLPHDAPAPGQILATDYCIPLPGSPC